MNKTSVYEMKRLVETAVADVCDFPEGRYYYCVDAVEVRGNPPSLIRAWATLHFFEGTYCCGEPGCHTGLYGGKLEAVADHVRRAMNLRQNIDLEVVETNANYHHGVNFTNDARKT